MYYLYIHVFTYQATIYIDSSVGSTVRTSLLREPESQLPKISSSVSICAASLFFRSSSSVAHGKIRTAGPTLAQDSMSHLCSKRHQECGSLPTVLVGSFVGTLRVVPVVVRSECPKQRVLFWSLLQN